MRPKQIQIQIQIQIHIQIQIQNTNTNISPPQLFLLSVHHSGVRATGIGCSNTVLTLSAVFCSTKSNQRATIAWLDAMHSQSVKSAKLVQYFNVPCSSSLISIKLRDFYKVKKGGIVGPANLVMPDNMYHFDVILNRFLAVASLSTQFTVRITEKGVDCQLVGELLLN